MRFRNGYSSCSIFVPSCTFHHLCCEVTQRQPQLQLNGSSVSWRPKCQLLTTIVIHKLGHSTLYGAEFGVGCPPRLLITQFDRDNSFNITAADAPFLKTNALRLVTCTRTQVPTPLLRRRAPRTEGSRRESCTLIGTTPPSGIGQSLFSVACCTI